MPLVAVPNVSEGRDARVNAALAAAVSTTLLDVHSDPDHNRSVFTLAGPDSDPDVLADDLTRLAEVCIEHIDMRTHSGVHPALGALDVVPLVIKTYENMESATHAMLDLTRRYTELGIGVYRYGFGADSLPSIRRDARRGRPPHFGVPHPSAGCVCLGRRAQLVAFNVDLDPSTPIGVARSIADAVRTNGIRTLALWLPRQGRVQVSMNLIEPERVGLQAAWNRVTRHATALGAAEPESAELVGLAPRVATAGLSNRLAALIGIEGKILEDRFESHLP